MSDEKPIEAPIKDLNDEIDSPVDGDSPKSSKTKHHKGSIFSHFKKIITKKKSKSIDDTNQTKKQEVAQGKDDVNNEHCEFKGDKRASGIRLSFGKGNKTNNTSTNKEENKEDSKAKDSSRSNARPHSMVFVNSHPPRYGYLAGFGWYWGPLSRSEATLYLRRTEDGSFLVRDSEGDPNKFTLSFKGAGQIFHNRILRKGTKYAFLPEEEFDSIPALIEDAKKRSRTSAYCFSRSTDNPASANQNQPSSTTNEIPENAVSTDHNRDSTNSANQITGKPNDPIQTAQEATGDVSNNNSNSTSNGNCKHEVRLLYPVSRYKDGVRSLAYLCRFMIRQYCGFQDLEQLNMTEDVLVYVKCSKYYL